MLLAGLMLLAAPVGGQAQGTNRMAIKATSDSRLTTSILYNKGGDITVEAWVYPTATVDWAPFLTLTPPDSVPASSYFDYGEYSFALTQGYAYIDIAAYDDRFSCDSGTPLTLNAWSHVAFVIEGTTLSIYVNGDLRFIEPRGVAVRANAYVVNVAGDPYGFMPYLMADLRVWSVARTSAQLNQTMPMGSITGPTSGLVANWSFGQTGLPFLADATGTMPLSEVGTIQYFKLLSGTLVTSVVNTQSGPLTIDAGTFQVGSGGAIGTLGSGNVVNNATLGFNRSDNVVIPNVISGSGSLSKSGVGTTSLTANNTYTGTTTISGGTLQVGNGGATGTLGSGTVVNNATLAFNRSDNVILANPVSGTGKLVKDGDGGLTLSGSKTFTGGTDVNSGVLYASGALSSVAGNTFTIGPSATWSFAAGNVFGFFNASPANAIVVQAGGVLRNEGNKRFNLLPALTLSGGLVRSMGTEAGYSFALRGGVTVNGGATTSTIEALGVGLGATTVTGTTFNVLDGTAELDLLVSGTLVDGPGSSWPTPQASFLTKTGAGRMRLTGANTYSGVTTISEGVLEVGDGGATGTLGSGTVVNNATLALNRSDNVTLANPVSGTGKLVKDGDGGLTLSGSKTFTGGIDVVLPQLKAPFCGLS